MECREVQFRDFVIELLRQEVDNVIVGLKARTIGPWPSGKTKRSSEVDADDFQAFKALRASKVEVVRRVVHNLCVFAHQGIGVPVAMHTTVSEGVDFQVSAAATDGCWDAATSSPILPCCCRNSWRFGTETPSGREKRSPRTIHHDVQDPKMH